jgi:4-hydroxyphenylpyruvate dioxygenase
MKRSQLAINSVSTIRAGLEESLAAYQSAGFKNVEFTLRHVKDYMEQGHSLADVKQLLQKHDLSCIGGFECALEAFSPEEQRARNHQLIVDNARLLAELGATSMVVGTDGPVGQQSASPIEELASAFAEVASDIKETGISLCIEFYWSPVVKSLRTAVEIARRSRADNVGVLFDPAHFHCTPTKLDQLNAETVPYIKHVHVDDMNDKPGELSDCNGDRVLPGEGCLDLKSLFRSIEDHGYSGYFSIEMFSEKLWSMPAEEASKLMYNSLLPLCESE